jgi:hypothetical protein
MNEPNKRTRMDVTSAAAAAPPPPSDEQRLAALESKLTKAEKKLEEWSEKVENAPIGSPEKAEAKEERAFWKGERDLALQQIAGK